MIEYRKTRPGTPTPRRAHPTDAGVDLTAQAVANDAGWVDEFYEARMGSMGQTMTFGTGVAVAIPEGHVGLVFVRSSVGIKRGLVLANGTGVIDAGYRGEIVVCLQNTRDTMAVVEKGERIAQLAIVPCDLTEWREVSSLDDTGRGQGGIGSTGK